MKKHKLTGQGGKGSARRNSNEKAYADNWDAIFGKNKDQKLKQKSVTILNWDGDKDEKDKHVNTESISKQKTQ
jgi:hypothetical protein